MTGLSDSFQRPINYMRVAVTDRCNFRCVYCMPEAGVPWMTHNEILSFEEMATIIRAGAEMGITRIRITGGEPLVRHGIVDFVKLVAEIPGMEDISLTTKRHLSGEVRRRPQKSRINAGKCQSGYA